MAKRKGQQDNDLQNTTQKTKYRATQTPLSHRLKKERQYNGQEKGTDNTMAKRKKTNNDLQNIIQKTKDRTTRTHSPSFDVNLIVYLTYLSNHFIWI